MEAISQVFQQELTVTASHQDARATANPLLSKFESPKKNCCARLPECSRTGSLEVSESGENCLEICSHEEEHDKKMLARLNPDYVRETVNDPKESKQLLLNEKKLRETFVLEKNAELWLFSQIMKCAMLASTVAPDAEQVSTFASVILQKYGNRPITHIAIFFGYAQTGQHYYDEYEIGHYGAFDLSRLLNDLGNHMRIASVRRYNIQEKKNAFLKRIKLLTEEAEGRILIYEEIVANLPPEERAKEIAKNGQPPEDFYGEGLKAIKQKRMEHAKQLLEAEKRQMEDWLNQ